MYRYISFFLICIALLVYGDSGGPDEFGYTWIDSNEPGGPEFEWIEISGTGIPLGLGDDDGIVLALEDDFEFYGMNYNEISICSNGWACLGHYSDYWWPRSFYAIPDPGIPNSFLGIYACDLHVGASPGDVYFQDFGDYAVVEWYQICEYYHYPEPAFTFEIILDYSRRTIKYQYLDIEETYSYTAYIGIENETGTVGLLIGTWGPYGGCLEDNYAIRFRSTPVASVPYGNTFEYGEADFTMEGDWEIGSLPLISPAFPPPSGLHCLATLLSEDYENNADWTTECPYIDAVNIDFPIVDFSQFHRMQEGHDGGILEASTDEGITWTTVEPESGYPVEMTAGPLSGQYAFSGNTDGWEKVSFDLVDYSGLEFMLRFRFLSDASTTDMGWFIDNFGYHHAYGVLHGNIDLAYHDLDDGVLVEIPDMSFSTLTDEDGYFFIDSVFTGLHHVRVSKEGFVPRDSVPFNMERFDTVYLDILLAPELYSEDFEEDSGEMVANPIEGWQWGIPDSMLEDAPTMTHSGNRCWGTNLTGKYNDDANWKLAVQIPLYDVQWPLLCFWTWYSFEEIEVIDLLSDGGNIKVSVDGGDTWELVYPVDGYDGIIAYPSNEYLGGQYGFGGESNGNFWHIVSFPLYEYAGNPDIQIIFEMGSDESHGAAGWYIDDITLSDDSSYVGYKEKACLPRELFLTISPNPFNSSAEVIYNCEGSATLDIIDLSGKLVDSIPLSQQAGVNHIIWNADGIPSGVYLLKLSDRNRHLIKKAIILR